MLRLKVFGKFNTDSRVRKTTHNIDVSVLMMCPPMKALHQYERHAASNPSLTQQIGVVDHRLHAPRIG
jgi:hypothetical protein